MIFLLLLACMPQATDTTDTGAQLDPTGFQIDGDGFSASFPMMGLRAWAGAGGLRLQTEDSELSLGLVAWGRGEGLAVEAAAPRAGVGRVVYARGPDVQEWWTATHDRLQVGWDLARPPAGEGPVSLEVEVEGATVSQAGEELIFSAPDRDLRFADLHAWDATGRALSAWMEPAEGGLRISVEDDDAVWPIHVDPTVFTSAWSVKGTNSDGYLGRVFAHGDFNKDGYSDLAVAEYPKGKVYLYYGSAAGLSTSATTITDSNGFGSALDVADINRDGYDDLVTGGAGVSVYRGGSTGLSTSYTQHLSSTASSFAGQIQVGDFNGDTYKDVIVSSADSSGTIYEYDGNGTNFASAASSSFTNQYTSYMRVGDFNKDGRDDAAIVHSSAAGGWGAVYIHMGSSAGLSSSVALTIYGTSGYSGDGIAADLGPIGDYNGDGYDDLLLGDSGYNYGQGIVSLYYGSATGLPATASLTFSNTSASFYGYSASSCGDVNGDGYDDAILGSSISKSRYGEVELHLGGASGLSSSVTGTFAGAATYDYVGSVAGSAGDVNGDGVADLYVGAWQARVNYNNNLGAAYVIHGFKDADGDGYDSSTDCNDGNAAIHPGVAEITGDGVDQNCDGTETCYDDDDDDGYLDKTGDTRASTDTDCSDAYEGLSTDPTTDCNDVAVSVHPGATETVADGVDQDCDGGDTCYKDGDHDTYGGSTTITSSNLSCSDLGESSNQSDCNDASSAVRPGATEIVADGMDQNCDGAETCYDDDDDDGYLDKTGDTRASTDTDCNDPYEGLSTDPTTDCNDVAVSVHPGAPETVADGVDQDCDGGDACYKDGDRDTYGGSTTVSSANLSCGDAGESTNTSDCDDSVATIHPGATETVADGVDQDCDSGDRCYTDGDNDGYGGTATTASADLDCTDTGESTVSTDCSDGDHDSHPNATESVADGIDQDCDGGDACYKDGDHDGYGGTSWVASGDLDCADLGEATSSSDCDDSRSSIRPGAAETPADGIDQDCDGGDACYADTDGDAFGSASTIVSADMDCGDAGESSLATDCNDADHDAWPGAPKVVADGVDQDCDAGDACYKDGDLDSYGGTTTVGSTDLDCADSGESVRSTDCDDSASSVHPGAAETGVDGIDQDCDGGDLCYQDLDGDQYGSLTTVASPDLSCVDSGEATVSSDCDDGDATTWPGAPEQVGDGVDQDCDGGDSCYVDSDLDGHGVAGTLGSTDLDCIDPGEAPISDDCSDASATVHPGAVELVADGIDQDCNGGDRCYVDSDVDRYGSTTEVESPDLSCVATGESATSTDCDDANPDAWPGAVEIPGDGVDQDCDGVDSCYADLDGDGQGTGQQVIGVDLGCDGVGESKVDTDCDDAAADTFLGAPETPADGVDEDCDGEELCWIDEDGDGVGGTGAAGGALDCSDVGLSAQDGDCDDADPNAWPGASEVPADGVDEDCDGQESCYQDQDGDQFGTDTLVLAALDCAAAAGVNGDCDDTAPDTFPGAPETAADGEDQDCDGGDLCYVDGDGDSYGGDALLSSPNLSCDDGGEAKSASDCDDGAVSIWPGAAETCNGLDDNCDGNVDEGLSDCDTEGKPSTCGCTTSGDPGVWLAAAGALGVLVRRRRG